MSILMFGTDGVRGTPGHAPLDEPTLRRLGAAAVCTLDVHHPTLLSARDTRESGPWIEQQLAAGVRSQGGTLVSVGVMPTPAAAFLVASEGFASAFVISASHNPFPDNGVKLLTADGEKASPDLETRLRDMVVDAAWEPKATNVDPLPVRDLTESYLAHVRSVLAGSDGLGALRIVLDCANGATSVVAPRVFRQLGFEVIATHAEPDGRNINSGCGSTHPEVLRRIVRDTGCQIGVAFDGDGDRALLVDGDGDLVDGDAILFICARYLDARGELPGHAIVATVMSNIGLEVALRETGVAVHRCPVGDRQVREEMCRRGVVLGGEQSGHIIFSKLLPTGDGLLTALSVLRVMSDTGRELSELREGLEVYPQVLVNVPVRSKPALATEPAITDAVARAEATLGEDGRVLIRYSGTEPLLRVMIEGRDSATVRQLAEAIAAQARARLG